MITLMRKTLFLMLILLTSMMPQGVAAVNANETPTGEDTCIEGDVQYYSCPDGSEVAWCGCSDGEWICIISPENDCGAVCGDTICEREKGESYDNCPLDCVSTEVVKREESIEDYAATLVLSADEQNAASVIIGYISDCAAQVDSGSYYDMNLECRKLSYLARASASVFAGLSDADWDEFVAYIMINSRGEPDHWTEDGNIRVSNWKNVNEKLRFGFNRWEHDFEQKVGADFNIQWNEFPDVNEADVKRAEQDYWDWEDEQRKNALKGQVTVVSSSLGDQLLEVINDIRAKAEAFDANPSDETAYNLAYAQRVAEGMLRGISDSTSGSGVKEACDYAKLNGPGKANLWENEFGNIEFGDLEFYESATRQGFRLRFNCWEDSYEDRTNMWLGGDLDRDSRITYGDAIKRGRSDAEEEAKELEVAGRLKEYLETFTITPENREIANEIIDDVNAIVEQVEAIEAAGLTPDNIYALQYNITLLEGKFQGTGDSLLCDDMGQVGPYVMIYTPGTAEIWGDEFEGLSLSEWKQVLENDFIRLNINWNCDEWSGRSWFNFNGEWSAAVLRGLGDEYINAVDRARNDGWEEADKLKKKRAVIEIRKNYNFTLEQEDLGNEIIAKIESLRIKAIDFEKEPTSDKAYQLKYDSIILTSELEGFTQAYRKEAKMVGLYIILYGPGYPDIWRDEFGRVEVGDHVEVYRGDDIEFGFNRWYDEHRDEGGFHVWMNFGMLRINYKEDLKRAEKEAWREAEKIRKRRMAEKLRRDLEEVVDVTAQVNNLKEFITLLKKYVAGEATAFDLELLRLQTSDKMRDIDKVTRDAILVSDLGDDIPPPDIWYEWEFEDIHVGGWRELIEFNRSSEDIFASIDSWCDWEYEDECNVELRIDWRDWGLVRKELDKANELFWRQKRELELADEIQAAIDSKSTYSLSDQAVEGAVVDLIAGLKSIGGDFDSIGVEELVYSVLVQKDRMNDKLDEASDERIAEVAIAETDGFHEYDFIGGRIGGVFAYSTDDFEILVMYHEVFKPFFIEVEEELDYEFEIDVIWKDWSDDIADAVDRAYDRYEREQAAARRIKLIAKRDLVVPSDLQDTLQLLADSYEAGTLKMRELKERVNAIYYRIMGYDNEIAYLSALSENPFPDFTAVNIVITTAHVFIHLYENPFNYRFGGAVMVGGARFAPEFERHAVEIKATGMIGELTGPMGVMESGGITERDEVTGGAVIQSRILEETTEAVIARNLMREGVVITEKDDMDIAQIIISPKGDLISIEGDAGELFHDDIMIEIEEEKAMIMDDKRIFIERMYAEEDKIFESRRMVSRRMELGGDRLLISGVKPRLKYSVSMTTGEVKNLAEEVKEKWNELATSGVLEDIIYNMNWEIDKYPSLSEAIREWGDVTTSIRLKYLNESVFEISFRTEDGLISWVEYGLADGAGENDGNVFIDLDFEALMSLKNWWETSLKNAEGPLDFILSLPGLAWNVVGMMITGKISVSPFGVIWKIPSFMKIFFEVMGEASGLNI